MTARLKAGRNSVPITYTSTEQVDVYRFSFLVTFFVPLGALVAQSFLPHWFPFFLIFDLPLLVVIFFALARRNPVAGLLTGAVIGIAQDALTHNPIGLYGIAKTVVGFAASSLGVRIDVENPGSRLLVTVFFYAVHESIYFFIVRYLVRTGLHWTWQHELGSAVANGIVAVFLFAALDRLKLRT